MCIDLTKLNAITKPEEYPILDKTAIQDWIWDSQVSIMLDLKSGFHNMKLNLNTSPLLGMVTSDRLYVWKRMPFGILGSPYYFQYIMDAMLCKDLMV